MTETPTAATSADVEDAAAKKPAKKAASKSAGLSSMLLADLKSMAAGLGIAGAGSMKKAQLVDAIKATQSGSSAPAAARNGAEKSVEQDVEKAPEQPAESQTVEEVGALRELPHRPSISVKQEGDADDDQDRTQSM